MFDFNILGPIALLLLAGVAIVFAYRKAYESTPLSPVHKGKAHDHSHDKDGDRFSCKFDAEEVRRTANQKRPRIEPGNAAADPKVAAILAAVQQSRIETAIKQLSGELPITVGGKQVKLVTRNSYHGNIELAIQHLEAFYASVGLKTERHMYKVRGKTYYNLIAEKTGKVTPKNVLYVGGHLDSTAGWPWSNEELAPGADDDASGTVGVMECAIALSKMDTDHTVRFCHFTGEEQGLYGSYAYSDVVSKKTDEKVIGMIQMDMIGYCKLPGNRVDLHDNVDQNGSHSLVVILTQNAARYGLNLNVVDTHNRAVENRSDHAGFLDHGFRAIMVSEEFTEEGFTPFYHTKNDRIVNMNLPFMTDVIRMVLAGVIELSGAK